MWRFTIIILSVLALTSCRTSKSLEQYITKTDTVFIKSVQQQRYDSIVFVHDSIYQTNEIYVTLDTAGNEIKRIEYHNRDHYNTSNTASNKTTEKADSSRTVSISDNKFIEKTTVINKLSFFQQLQIWTGRIIFSLFLIFLIYYLFTYKIKSKFQ